MGTRPHAPRAATALTKAEACREWGFDGVELRARGRMHAQAEIAKDEGRVGVPASQSMTRPPERSNTAPVWKSSVAGGDYGKVPVRQTGPRSRGSHSHAAPGS